MRLTYIRDESKGLITDAEDLLAKSGGSGVLPGWSKPKIRQLLNEADGNSSGASFATDGSIKTGAQHRVWKKARLHEISPGGGDSLQSRAHGAIALEGDRDCLIDGQGRRAIPGGQFVRPRSVPSGTPAASLFHETHGLVEVGRRIERDTSGKKQP